MAKKREENSAEIISQLRREVEYWKARAETAEEGMRTTTRALLTSQRRYVEEVVKAATEGKTPIEKFAREFLKTALAAAPDKPSAAMQRGTTEAETCRLNGWTVGTVLVGDEGRGPEKIKITAIGEEKILARRIENQRGETIVDTEGLWTLSRRKWKAVTSPQDPESNFSATVQDANALAAGVVACPRSWTLTADYQNAQIAEVVGVWPSGVRVRVANAGLLDHGEVGVIVGYAHNGEAYDVCVKLETSGREIRVGRENLERVAARDAATDDDIRRYQRRVHKDRDWQDYPLGTKAHAVNGGHWVRVANGWKWCTGDTFPTPGGDACGRCIELPEEKSEGQGHAKESAKERPSLILGDRVRVASPEHPYYGWEGYVYQVQYASDAMVRCNIKLRNGSIVCAAPDELVPA